MGNGAVESARARGGEAGGAVLRRHGILRTYLRIRCGRQRSRGMELRNAARYRRRVVEGRRADRRRYRPEGETGRALCPGFAACTRNGSWIRSAVALHGRRGAGRARRVPGRWPSHLARRCHGLARAHAAHLAGAQGTASFPLCRGARQESRTCLRPALGWRAANRCRGAPAVGERGGAQGAQHQEPQPAGESATSAGARAAGSDHTCAAEPPPPTS